MHLFNWSLLCAVLLSLATAGCVTSSSPRKESSVYEMRTYYAAPGKLNDLHARFRNHTMRLFAKHGIENVGYWVPVNNSENKLVFLLKYPSREARESAWSAFAADPEWVNAKAQSEANGALTVQKDQIFLQQTDYSPAFKNGTISKNGVFELRTYTTPAGFLPNLDSRFRDHTMGLFAKHGMNNWLYFHKTSDQQDADTKLIYFLTHQSMDAAKRSFDGFRKDPLWIAAKGESEKGGSLTVKEGGVKSEFLVATDYSPTK